MHEHHQFKFIRELMKNRTEEEIVEAEENFAGFIDLVAEMIERRGTQKP